MEDMPMVEEVYTTDAEMADYDTYDYEMQEETAGDAVPEYEMDGETAPDAAYVIHTESITMVSEATQPTSLEVLMPQASAVPSPAPILMPSEIASPQPPPPTTIDIAPTSLAPDQVVLPPSPDIPTILPVVTAESVAPPPQVETSTPPENRVDVSTNIPPPSPTPPEVPTVLPTIVVEAGETITPAAEAPSDRPTETGQAAPSTSSGEVPASANTEIVVPLITLYYNDNPFSLFQASSELPEPLLRDYFDFYLTPLTDLLHALKAHETTHLHVAEGTILGLEHQGLDLCIDQVKRLVHALRRTSLTSPSVDRTVDMPTSTR